MSEGNPLKPPKSYFIEITNHCNLRCSMCNFHSPVVPGKRRKGFMDKDLAKEILKEIAGFGENAWVALHGAGEPLLHKGLIEIIEFAQGFENISCGFLTNGVILDKDKTERLISAGISWIGFSLDGIVKEKFEKYRVGSNYEEIMKNVLYFLERNSITGKKVHTLVNMTVQEEMKEDVEAFIDYWLDRVDEVAISPCRPIGSRHNILVDSSKPRQPCYMLYEMMVIFWDGEVGLCCEDWFNFGKMGNVNHERMIDIWNGKGFKDARLRHERGLFNEIDLCKDCNSWFRKTIEEKDEKRKCLVQRNAWQYVYRRN